MRGVVTRCSWALGALMVVGGWMVLTTQFAGAQTPDGDPPSVEDDCDGLVGAEYGLCNAYCEAMDCDGRDPHASATACEKVRDNFVKQSGGVAPPCERPPVVCPCLFPAIECERISDGRCAGKVDALRVDYTCADDAGPFGVAFGVESGVCFTKTGRVGLIEEFKVTPEQMVVCSDIVFALAPSYGAVCPAP